MSNDRKLTENAVLAALNEDGGWTEGASEYRGALTVRNFYKRYATPTGCSLNTGSEGQQLCLSLTSLNDESAHISFEVELRSMLCDGTWVSFTEYGSRDIKYALKRIPRLLTAWEAAAQETRTND